MNREQLDGNQIEMNEYARVRCPSCGRKYKVPPQNLGRLFQCKNCGHQTVAGNRANADAGVAPDAHVTSVQQKFEQGPTQQPIAKRAFVKSREIDKTWLRWIALSALGLIVIGAGVLFVLLGAPREGLSDSLTASSSSTASTTVESGSTAGHEGGTARPVTNGNAQPDPNHAPNSGAAPGNPARNNPAQGNRGPGDAWQVYAKWQDKYFGNAEPVIQNVRRADPTLDLGHPSYYLDYPEMLDRDDHLLFGLNYGGSEFIEQYRRGLNSPSADSRFDCAISLANWGEDVPRAVGEIVLQIFERTGRGAADPLLNDRIQLAQLIIDAYPDVVADAMNDDSDAGIVFAVNHSLENFGLNEATVQTVADGLLAAAATGTVDEESAEAFAMMYGYSQPDRELLQTAIDAAPDWYQRSTILFPAGGLMPANPPFQPGRVDHGGRGKFGLNRMPPMLDEISHIKFGPLSRLKDADDEIVFSNDLLVPNWQTFLEGVNLDCRELEYLTLGRVNQYWNDDNGSPFLVIAGFRNDIDTQRFAGLAAVDGMPGSAWRFGPGFAVALADSSTILAGTANEVRAALARGTTNSSPHCAANQWPDISGFDLVVFDGIEFVGQTWKPDGYEVENREEWYFAPEVRNNCLGRNPEQVASNKISKANRDAESERRRREIGQDPSIIDYEEVFEGTHQVNSMKHEPDNRPLPRLSFGAGSSGNHALRTQLAGIATDIANGEGFSPDNYAILDSVVENDFELPLCLAAHPVIAAMLDDVEGQLGDPDSPVTDSDFSVTLERIYQYRNLFGPDDISRIIEIGEQVEFQHNAIGRARWTVAVLSGIHDPLSLQKISESFNSAETQIAFNTRKLTDEEAERVKAIVEVDQKHAQLLSQRLSETNERISKMADYYLVAGDEQTQLAAIKLAFNVNRIYRELAYRMLVVAGDSSTPPAVVAAIKQTRPPVKLVHDNKALDQIKIYADAVKTTEYYDGISEPLDSQKNVVTGLKPIDFAARTFDILVPDLDEELMPAKLSGKRNAQGSVKKLDGESMDEWSARIERQGKDPATYAAINRVEFYVKGGDVLQIHPFHRYRTVAEVRREWELGSAALGRDLLSEEDGDSGAAFDRIRYFKVNGIPKAERVVCHGENDGMRVRWIGSGLDEHPDYVARIMESFKDH